MNKPDLFFERPLLLLLILPALAFVLFQWFRLSRAQRQPARQKAAVLLRCGVCLLLVPVIAGLRLTLPPSAEAPEAPRSTETPDHPRVLVVADDPSDASLITEYLPPETEPVFVTPADAPALLTRYAGVILNGTAAADLPGGWGSMLSRYVQGGGALLVTGGKHGLSLGGMTGMVYETLLPVLLEYTEENGEGISLMLVLDCSNSMTDAGGWGNTGGGDRLANAKQGAIRSIEALTERDLVGLISFNSKAVLRAEPAAATDTHKAVLSRIISSLTTAQGTYYTEALTLAREQMRNMTTLRRHVIFLSDGEPFDHGFDQVVREMAEEGITVSAMALGFSSNVLKNIAENGGGRYYAVTDAADLPSIMLSETEKVTSDPLVEKTAAVVLPGGLPAGLPDITGFIGTTLRKDAELLLRAEGGAPLLARRQLGEGTVTVFTSDLTGEWTASWQNSEAGKAELKQILQFGVAAPADLPEAVISDEPAKPREANIQLPVMLLALVMLLSDIALRRLRLSDIRMLFRKEK